MADLSFKPIGADVTVPKINLSEMIGTMRGLQEYRKAKEVNPLVIRQQQAVTQQQEMQNKADQAAKLIDAQSALINHPLVVRAAQNPASVSADELTGLIKQYGELGRTITGVPKERVAEITAPLLDIIKTNPAQLQQRLRNDYLATVDRTARAGLLQPTLKDITGFAPTGERVTQGVNINPFAGAMGAPIPGTVSFAGPISPMTPSGRTDPQGNPTAYVTDPRTGAVREVTIPAGMAGAPLQPPASGPGAGTPTPDMTGAIPPGAGAAARGPVPAGLPPPPPGGPANYEAPKRLTAGEAGMLEQNIKTAKEDWNQTVFDNAGAQARIASFQKIKSLVPEAFTGVGGEQKKFVSGLLQSIGLPANIAETSSTEELAKNAAILNLAGGNTDAARAIAEMATPSTKLTKEGILRVTDQLIGIERMKQSKAQFLSPYANDASKYAEVKQNFDRYADPRMFQETSPEEVAKMKAAMSPKEREEFAYKVKMARQLGII